MSHELPSFLIDAGEPEKIGVLFEFSGGIAIAHVFIIASEYGNAVRFHLSRKTFAVVDEKLLVNRFVFHGEHYFLFEGSH